MRILIHSATPECNSGYGNQVKELAQRLRRAGHFVRVATKHAGLPWHTWDGIEVFEGTNHTLLNQMLKDEHFDYILSMWDIWLMNDVYFPAEKWVAWVPIDTEWISDRLLEVVKKTGRQIAMSRHGERELRRTGFEPMFAPCGLDARAFRINPQGRKRFRDDFGMKDDTFVVGSVGLNYGDDRKGFIQLMLAFKRFLKFYPNSALYLHTHALGAYAGTVNFRKIAEKLEIADRVCWPHQLSNDIGRIDPAWLSDIYNGLDMFCLPTKGEGFGIPLIEAQACGTPVAVTGTTAGPELCETGDVITVDDDDLQWIGLGAFRHEPRPSAIVEALKAGWERWIGGYDRETVRWRVLKYDWENVWLTFWAPILGDLEAGLRAVRPDSIVDASGYGVSH